MLPHITNKKQIELLIDELGFLPFWKNKAIQGYSIIENVDPILFKDGNGVWSWKNEIVSSGNYLYGKIFNNNAGFISKEWIADFVNYRRDGYNFDSFVECGLAANEAIPIYQKIEEYRSISTKALRKECSLSRKYNSVEYNRILDYLMMNGFICTSSIEKQLTKEGIPYGWGMATYSTVDFLFGTKLTQSAYKTNPNDSLEKMIQHILKVYPECSYQQAKIMLKR